MAKLLEKPWLKDYIIRELKHEQPQLTRAFVHIANVQQSKVHISDGTNYIEATVLNETNPTDLKGLIVQIQQLDISKDQEKIVLTIEKMKKFDEHIGQIGSRITNLLTCSEIKELIPSYDPDTLRNLVNIGEGNDSDSDSVMDINECVISNSQMEIINASEVRMDSNTPPGSIGKTPGDGTSGPDDLSTPLVKGNNMEGSEEQPDIYEEQKDIELEELNFFGDDSTHNDEDMLGDDEAEEDNSISHAHQQVEVVAHHQHNNSRAGGEGEVHDDNAESSYPDIRRKNKSKNTLRTSKPKRRTSTSSRHSDMDTDDEGLVTVRPSSQLVDEIGKWMAANNRGDQESSSNDSHSDASTISQTLLSEANGSVQDDDNDNDDRGVKGKEREEENDEDLSEQVYSQALSVPKHIHKSSLQSAAHVHDNNPLSYPPQSLMSQGRVSHHDEDSLAPSEDASLAEPSEPDSAHVDVHAKEPSLNDSSQMLDSDDEILLQLSSEEEEGAHSTLSNASLAHLSDEESDVAALSQAPTQLPSCNKRTTISLLDDLTDAPSSATKLPDAPSSSPKNSAPSKSPSAIVIGNKGNPPSNGRSSRKRSRATESSASTSTSPFSSDVQVPSSKQQKVSLDRTVSADCAVEPPAVEQANSLRSQSANAIPTTTMTATRSSRRGSPAVPDYRSWLQFLVRTTKHR